MNWASLGRLLLDKSESEKDVHDGQMMFVFVVCVGTAAVFAASIIFTMLGG